MNLYEKKNTSAEKNNGSEINISAKAYKHTENTKDHAKRALHNSAARDPSKTMLMK